MENRKTIIRLYTHKYRIIPTNNFINIVDTNINT